MPFAPVTTNSGAVLAQGFGQMGRNLFGALSGYLETREESKGFDSLIETTAKEHANDPKFLETYGEQLAKAPGMGLSQKKALAGSLALYGQKQNQERDFAERKRVNDATIANYGADNARADQQFRQGQEDRAARTRFTGELARYTGQPQSLGDQFANGTAGMETGRPLDLAGYVSAASRAGVALDPREVASLAHYLPGSGGKAAPEAPRIETLEDGTKVMWNPTTGKSEVLRDKPDANTVPAREQIGAIKAKLAALTKQGRPITDPKAAAAYDAKLEALFAQLDRFSVGGAGTPAPTAAGAVNDPLGLFN